MKGIGFLDSFVDTLRSTTPHHLLMLRTVHFMEASVVDILFVIAMLASSETQGQMKGARESLNGRKNMARRKVKNGNLKTCVFLAPIRS